MSSDQHNQSFVNQVLDRCKRINALTEIGLIYAENPYDIERYQELRDISRQMMASLNGQSLEQIEGLFRNDPEYKTPQVDIRAVVFDRQDRILMVREKVDGKWSLPGGWADIGYSPREVAAKEVKEETGLDVTPERLFAVFDKKCHPHPPQLHYVYKMFIGCKLLGGEIQIAFDTLDVGFFSEDALPELSTDRVTLEQMHLMFEYHRNPDKQSRID